MKYCIGLFLVLLQLILPAQKKSPQKNTATAKYEAVQKSELLSTKYFVFTSNPELNAHLFLYNKAMTCKFKKTSDDSLAYYSFKDKLKVLNPKDLADLNQVVLFYKDSLLSKDLLFDSLMRDFTDYLSLGLSPGKSWQPSALAKLKLFQPTFNKFYWKQIDAANRAWIAANKMQITKSEPLIVPELEKVYQTNLPESKVYVDLVSYATWAGAYSFHDGFAHLIFSTEHSTNKTELAPEIIFHEASHFLIAKLNKQIKLAINGRDIRQSISLWHNLIFYTTGYMMQKQLSKEGKAYEPYYVKMKMEEKFVEFKTTAEVCRTYWNPYLDGQGSFEEAVKNVVDHLLQKK